jgi:hypothetical protein
MSGSRPATMPHQREFIMRKSCIAASVIAALAAFLFLSGCAGDSAGDSKDDVIVGTWTLDQTIGSARYTGTLVVKSDGTFSETLKVDGASWFDDYPGVWTVSGSTYSFTVDGAASPDTAVLSGSTLTMTTIAGDLAWTRS